MVKVDFAFTRVSESFIPCFEQETAIYPHDSVQTCVTKIVKLDTPNLEVELEANDGGV